MLRDSGISMVEEKKRQALDVFVNDVYDQEVALSQVCFTYSFF